MIRNYLLISFRNLRKHLSYSLINIVGLALGLATCLLLFTWIRHEVSYDSFHKKSDRLYRVSLEYSFGGQVAALAVSPTALLPALLSLPETETGVRIFNPSGYNPFIVKYEDRTFSESKFYGADSTFFDVFTYPLRKGNPARALNEPYSVVIRQSIAEKYFGDEDPLGKILRINNSQDYIVTGVFDELPTNTLHHFDFVASFHSFPAGKTPPIWWSANYQTYITTHINADLNALVKKNKCNCQGSGRKRIIRAI